MTLLLLNSSGCLWCCFSSFRLGGMKKPTGLQILSNTYYFNSVHQCILEIEYSASFLPGNNQSILITTLKQCTEIEKESKDVKHNRTLVRCNAKLNEWPRTCGFYTVILKKHLRLTIWHNERTNDLEIIYKTWRSYKHGDYDKHRELIKHEII